MAKSVPGTNILRLNMATLASKEHDNEKVCFKKKVANLQITKY